MVLSDGGTVKNNVQPHYFTHSIAVSTHPPTFIVMTIVMETWAETITKLSTISKGMNKPRSKEEEKKIKKENLLKYLAVIGNRYRGFKI